MTKYSMRLKNKEFIVRKECKKIKEHAGYYEFITDETQPSQFIRISDILWLYIGEENA